MKKKVILSVIFIIVLVFGYTFLKKDNKKITIKDFEMVKVERGDVAYDITATGNIQPINTVEVGTQVSGKIETVLADYNDEVKKGQILALLDMSTLVENKNEAEATLELAQAKEAKAKISFDRVKKLYADKLTSKSSYEDEEIQYKTAKADTKIAQANYNKAKKNYEYATISSPISGTIISKEIEQGQTVAASLSAPTLFTIAEDLSKMKIEVSIAEADIGEIQSNMPVSFTVDAYQGKKFDGVIKQIRLSPKEESNVVMYTVIVEFDNSSRLLLPGMTASVTIRAHEVKNVLKLSGMTLQYKPTRQLINQMNIPTISEIKENQEIVYQFKNGKIVPVVIDKGVANMNSFEILNGLNEGDEVIIDMLGAKKKK